MTHRLRVIILIALTFATLATVREAPAQQTIDSSAAAVPRLQERLANLKPESPIEYYLLGEEVAAEAGDTATRDLARRLLILAYETDQRLAKPRCLGPEVCRALAALAGPDGDKRWLRAMAMHLSEAGRSTGPASGNATKAEGGVPANVERKELSDLTAFKLATVLGRIRAGEGNKAKKDLALPEVREALESYSAVLESGGAIGAVQKLEKHIELWPYCPECRGKHVINRNENGTLRSLICPTCGGVPGPRLAQEELLGHLRMESALLRGIHRLWSAQVLADGAQPLRDPDPADLALTYRVDPEATVYRDGQWVKPEPAKANTPPADPAPKGK
ncbi:MAG: hypothetical protein ACT4PL_07390 [Phycisphaerales bacterium]